MVRPGVLTPGTVRAGVVRVGRPGVVRVGSAPVGLVSAGLVSAGLARPGSVSDGAPVRPGIPSPVDPSPGIKVAGAEPDPVSMPVGNGGRLMPNWERPWERAEISSPGSSMMLAACTNSRCCGAPSGGPESWETATSATGLATATAATVLKAVESRRRRRFGTEVSSIHGRRKIGYLKRLPAADLWYLDDGTDVTSGTRVTMLNCEQNATCAARPTRV